MLELNCYINILSDGGAENKDLLLEWVDFSFSQFHIGKHPFHLQNGIYKEENLSEPIGASQNLDRFVTYLNHDPFPVNHFDYIPVEV